MAIFKCKMCGGDLDIITDTNVVECEYCGTKQTIPSLDNEKKVNLFNRANRLRLNSEFDKAATIYESIIAEFPEEAEAYWGLCLCNYGIEYVDDPATAKKVPTCHRASFEKLLNDENFNLAMEYADISAQKVYRDEAREIDRIMEEILAISKNEKPYDIFICYKETDENGERTIDSVLAQDVYDALTAKGFKVFFARLSLEDKLGRMYEPYIFAALNSAKVMLCIGTKYEYFHAVWVKNEWSRFIKLMAKDKSKVLIPCFKDANIADLPTQFRALQAQDMGKIGFMQDLVRGVQKIVGEKPAVNSQPATVTEPAPNSRAMPIKYIHSMGARHKDDYFPNTQISSTINMDMYSCVAFNLFVNKFRYTGVAELEFKVYDDNNNILTNSTLKINVNPNIDKLGQVWIMRGDNGSGINPGRYKACFSVNGGPVSEYVFQVVNNSTAVNTNSFGMQTAFNAVADKVNKVDSALSKSETQSKSLLIYIVLAILFGSFGVHCFYAGDKKKGIIRLLLSLTGVGAVLSVVLSWVDVLKAIINGKI